MKRNPQTSVMLGCLPETHLQWVSSLPLPPWPGGTTGAGLKRCPWDCLSPPWSPAGPARWRTSCCAAPWRPTAASGSWTPAPGCRRCRAARSGAAPSHPEGGGSAPAARSHLVGTGERRGELFEKEETTDGGVGSGSSGGSAIVSQLQRFGRYPLNPVNVSSYSTNMF